MVCMMLSKLTVSYQYSLIGSDILLTGVAQGQDGTVELKYQKEEIGQRKLSGVAVQCNCLCSSAKN